jgi:hypothetical protein
MNHDIDTQAALSREIRMCAVDVPAEAQVRFATAGPLRGAGNCEGCGCTALD